jgi:hypothetical protein
VLTILIGVEAGLLILVARQRSLASISASESTIAHRDRIALHGMPVLARLYKMGFARWWSIDDEGARALILGKNLLDPLALIVATATVQYTERKSNRERDPHRQVSRDRRPGADLYRSTGA